MIGDSSEDVGKPGLGVKTDKIDAITLAKLHASGFVPEVWVG